MPVAEDPPGGYDPYAERYQALVARDAAASPSLFADYLLPGLLAYSGDLSGKQVLDAGCGEGRLARALAQQGAAVTGIDISPSLIEIARAQSPQGDLTYLCHDLTQPLPPELSPFDLIASNLVLNDVEDYRAFIRTMGGGLRPGGRLLMTLNNPYSAVLRGKVTHYFDQDATGPYQGLAAEGVAATFHHRTLERYLTAFLDSGFRLRHLSDLEPPSFLLQSGGERFHKYRRFPFFMLLAFDKMGLS